MAIPGRYLFNYSPSDNMLSLDEQIADVSGKVAAEPSNEGLRKHLETLWRLKHYQQQQQQREEARRQYEDNLLDEALKNLKANPHSQTAKDEWERVLILTGRKEHVEIDVVECILHTFRSAWQKLAWPFHVGKPAEKSADTIEDCLDSKPPSTRSTECITNGLRHRHQS
ncbi:hypothetical protein VOLCADRAFT_96002 [Volvox carteri f. nagariensis]|uniref:Uncharacterized protein n=1 Tax=Volvox carteri f. nagariensis TaxID=3068 RepID=D8U8Y3_VOLCA|nr:uncharacterized protein VOLCADRAFT_96002 [Volvox carteri f. nagariensis]EFJ43828.1 hypothetical protein VOLCADRAFT_96002 [Volvox carteri f. nagariensis]|eukprot:XP_002955074.1 hypothetical protein VOLCADRAFT_96002 [Volvox carteri f. nagariensis]